MNKALRIFFIILCLLMIASIGPSFSQEIYKFELMWGSDGTGNGQFKEPSGVGVDSSGNVYVADSGNNRVQKFDSYGNLIKLWGVFGEGEGEFEFPSGVTVDHEGYVYVLDENNRVQKFNPEGEFVTKVEIPSHGYCLCIDPAGNIYVGITTFEPQFEPRSVLTPPPPGYWSYFILKFSSLGNLIATWGKPDADNGQLYAASGIACDMSGDVYVTDSGNDRIKKFDSNGNLLTTWDLQGTLEGEFWSPSGITIDSSGYVYVTELRNNRIQKFNSEGKLITQWEMEGAGEGQFLRSYGVAVDASGNVYVSDLGNNRIQKFSEVPLPDLMGQWASLVQTCRDTRNGKKCRISGRITIQNIGNKKALPSFVRFYLSDDGQYDEGKDTLLKQAATAMIKAGKVMIKTFSYSFPLGETASGKYMIAVIDAGNTVTEADEINNYIVFGPIQ